MPLTEAAPEPEAAHIPFEELSPAPPEAETAEDQAVPFEEQAAESSGEPEVPFPEREEAEIPFPETEETTTAPSEPVAPRSHSEPVETPPATLQEAIDQVGDIIETLRQSLDEMEEVLELLEALERQTGADQHELESLRRALRQLHRPQDKAQARHSHRPRR